MKQTIRLFAATDVVVDPIEFRQRRDRLFQILTDHFGSRVFCLPWKWSDLPFMLVYNMNGDADLVLLKRLPQLQELDLNGTQVTDAGLLHLKEFPKLRKLQLEYTKITDAGLVHLKEMTTLRVLRLQKTTVSKSGFKELKTALPTCRILR